MSDLRAMLTAGKATALMGLIDLAENAENEEVRMEAIQMLLAANMPATPPPPPAPPEEAAEIVGDVSWFDLSPDQQREVAEYTGRTVEDLTAEFEAEELEQRPDNPGGVTESVPETAMVPATEENLAAIEAKLAAAQATGTGEVDEMPPEFRPGASGIGHARPNRKARRSKRHGR